MTSKDIIIRLIDTKAINGEEAYTLMNDILHDEMRKVYETLQPNWVKSTPYTISGTDYSTTALASKI